MRLTCLAAVLLLGINLSYAEEAKSPSAATGLCQEEIAEGFVCLFDGKTLSGWEGDTSGYGVEDGVLLCKKGQGGNLWTEKEYGNFAFRFEFKLQPNGNNGVAIRSPRSGGLPAYAGMEIQILDDDYKGIQPYQAHGSIYGVVAAKRGHQNPIGQWNCQEIRADGGHVKITLNGVVIVDADVSGIKETADRHPHPGLHNKKGYIGFCGHEDRIEFRKIRIKEL